MTECMEKGKISVIMGVYNCADTVIEAIQAIEKQTYKNWEFIICDDGSKDCTYETVMDYIKDDQRFILIRNEINCGLNRTLNNCLARAGGEFIARMDGDDLCDPKRFEKQVQALCDNPQYAVCGTPMRLFDQSGFWGTKTVPEKPSAEQVVSGNPICHATTLIRHAALKDVGGYTEDERMLRVEDVNLWIKLYEKGYCAINLTEPLYFMRNDQNALNRRKYRYRINSTYVRLQGCRKLHLGFRSYVQAFRPMVYGLVPGQLRHLIRHRVSYRKNANAGEK